MSRPVVTGITTSVTFPTHNLAHTQLDHLNPTLNHRRFRSLHMYSFRKEKEHTSMSSHSNHEMCLSVLAHGLTLLSAPSSIDFASS